MQNIKSNNGTVFNTDNGSGQGSIDHTGTGRPGAAIDQHGTGRPGTAIDGHGTGRPGVLGRLLACAMLVFGAASMSIAEDRNLQVDGLSLQVSERTVTLSWIESDGRLAVASGSYEQGYARLPVTLLSFNGQQWSKVQGSGSGGSDGGTGGKVQGSGSGGSDGGTGGKVQGSGSGGSDGGTGGTSGTRGGGHGGRLVKPAQPFEGEFEGGFVELAIQDEVAGVMILVYGNAEDRVSFAFDGKGSFLHRIRVQ